MCILYFQFYRLWTIQQYVELPSTFLVHPRCGPRPPPSWWGLDFDTRSPVLLNWLLCSRILFTVTSFLFLGGEGAERDTLCSS